MTEWTDPLSDDDDNKSEAERQQRAILTVPGGWIVHSGLPLSQPVYVPDPDAWAPGRDIGQRILAAVHVIQREIVIMSATLSQQLDAATADIKAHIATIATGVTALQTSLAAATASLTPGSTITQAQVDALVAVQGSVDTLADSLPPPAAA